MSRHPQSLYDRAELLARSHPLGTVAEIVGVWPSALSVMRRRKWKALDRDPRVRPVPSDFAIQAQHMTHRELIQHYQASSRTVTRWFNETRPRPKIKPPGRPRKVTREASA